MFCNNCGSQINDNASFCPMCGGQVGALQQNVQAQQGFSPMNQGFPPDPVSAFPPVPKKSKKPLIIVIAIILIAALIVGGIFLIPGLTDKDNKDGKGVAGSNNPDEVAKAYAVAYEMYDGDTLNKCLFFNVYDWLDMCINYNIASGELSDREEFFEYMAEELYGIRANSSQELFKVYNSLMIQEMTEDYGNYTLNTQVSSKQEVSLESFYSKVSDTINQDARKGRHNTCELLDLSKVSAVYDYDITIQVVVNGAVDDSWIQNVWVMNYGGEWKVVDSYDDNIL